MNERISQLIKQSYVTVQSPSGEGSTYFSQEKFAELIVRECMMICGAIQGAGEVRDMSDFASGAAQCRSIIKRDFGVKE